MQWKHLCLELHVILLQTTQSVHFLTSAPYHYILSELNESTVGFQGLCVIARVKTVINMGIHFQCKLPVWLQ